MADAIICVVFAFIGLGWLIFLAVFCLFGIRAIIPHSCKNAAFREYKARVEQSLRNEEQEFIKWLDEAKLAEERAAFDKFKTR